MTKTPRASACVFMAMSVDGFIAGPDDDLTFLEKVAQVGEDYGYGEFFASIQVLVLGRRTWDTLVGFDTWPYAGKRVIVATSHPSAIVANYGEETWSGDPRALLEGLFQEGCRRVYVDGGSLVRGFLSAQIVDELTLSIVPVLLGSGRPLFSEGLPTLDLRLAEAKSFSSGLVRLRFLAKTGNPEEGLF